MRRRTLIGGMLAAPMIAACDGDDPADPDAPTRSDGGGEPPDPPSVRMRYGPVEMTVAIASLVRTGEHLVLTLEVSADDPEDELPAPGPVEALKSFTTTDYSESRAFLGLRLLDLAGDRAAVIARDDEERSVCSDPFPGWSDRSGSAGAQSIQLVYGDLGTDRVAVLIPKGGLLAEVPVIEGEAPVLDVEEPVDLGEVALAPVHPLLSVSHDLTTTTRTESTQESATVSLGADVLFDSSSAELEDGAQSVIERAAQSLAEHEPGPVSVVGHTDSVDDDAFNQNLSEQRARAVADALGSLIDEGEYPLEASGRGESAPIADNGTEEGRALNRRVELTLDTPPAREQGVARELPEFDGPEATGEDGVLLESDGATPVRVRATGARLVEDHLVVRMEFTREDDEVDSVFGLSPSVGSAVSWLPLDYVLEKTEGGIAVMNGPVATFPALHRVGGEDSDIRPLTDLRTNSRLDGGHTRVSDIVYPVGTALEDTVTIQLVENGWRLTDVPVTR